jgi:hypothetical protein
MAWDPQAPFSLIIPARDGDKGLQLKLFSASNGVGANSVETATLLQILTETNAKSHRQVLGKCLEQWEESTSTAMETGDRTEDVKVDYGSLEFLKLLYSVTHLTETLVLKEHPTVADAVAYLRLHHTTSLEDEIDHILSKSRHPEEHPEYWKLLQTLVLRGCTSDAWNLLTYHSACQRAFASTSEEILDSYHMAQRQQDREGFLAFRAFLESAPLPGGTTDVYDADGEDDENQDVTQLLEGVRRLDYKLWDKETTQAAAMASFKTWHAALDSVPQVEILLRREPRLRPLLQILKGHLEDGIVIDTWAEALVAELLYTRPNLNVRRDLAARMKRAMTQYGASEAWYDKDLLAILDGNTGEVIHSLWKLGGGSGAALPATMTSLICNHLIDAKLLPESARELQTELLLAASDAILSSHAGSRRGIGMRLTALLLVPHCSSKRDIRITATLARALESFSPATDGEAKVVLDVVRPLVEVKKSLRILDGCISMIVSRFCHYEKCSSGKEAMEWLLLGKELEETLLEAKEVGDCYRLISKSSCEMSYKLLQLLLSRPHANANPAMAVDMVQALTKVQDMENVRLLMSLTIMIESLKLDRDVRSRAVAREIAKCLELHPGGYCLAPPSMQLGLLLLALGILEQDDERFQAGNAAGFESSFEVQGIKALMERFAHITVMTEETMKQEEALKLALAKGLMHALVTENGRRKVPKTNVAPHEDLFISQIDSYSLADQERLAQRLLGL